MRYKGHASYLGDEILSASPLKLVVLLYRGALDAIAKARTHLAAGDIRARSAAITKAIEIMAELNQSLDRERGTDVALQLERLYDYVLRLLFEANTQQIEPPLIEAERLLQTLLDAWQHCLDQESQAIRGEYPFEPTGYSAPETECVSYTY
jgi:flagellar protein FliS